MPDERESRPGGEHAGGPGDGLSRPTIHASDGRGSAVSVAKTPADAPQLQIGAKHPRRAEVTAAALLVLAVLAFAGFGAVYIQGASNPWLGGTLGAGMLFFGAGTVVWGKYLMPRGPFEEERHLMAADPQQRADLVADFASRGRVAVQRRGFLTKLLAAGGAVMGVVLAFPLLRSLGPKPGLTLYTTKWKKGSYLTTIYNQRLHVDDVAVGGIVTVFPEDDVGSAVSQTVLIRYQSGGYAPTPFPERQSWGPHGYLAFSKVCTHAGCPVSLWEKQLGKLVCPCHQSMFIVADAAEPVFGPAPRPLPQLPLYVDSKGYLRAQGGFDEPIGPGFWSRGAGPQ